MSRRKIFEDFQNIHKDSSKEDILEVLHRVYEYLSLNQVNPKLNSIEILLYMAKSEDFIDKNIKESQLADLEQCLTECSRNNIMEAVCKLDNFISPFSYMLDERISDFEEACIRLMIVSIGEKMRSDCVKGHKPLAKTGSQGSIDYVCERCGKSLN